MKSDCTVGIQEKRNPIYRDCREPQPGLPSQHCVLTPPSYPRAGAAPGQQVGDVAERDSAAHSRSATNSKTHLDLCSLSVSLLRQSRGKRSVSVGELARAFGPGGSC